MRDGYVIVYQDGYVGTAHDKFWSDHLLRWGKDDPDGMRPAYRLRIREKA